MDSPDSSSQQTVIEQGIDNKFGPHVLPPCKVCGAQATGYHYGANTCEACKGFFHRSLSKKEDYICLKNAKCELKPGNRSLCPYCRYKRCIEVGMSKGSIKTGRYSYAKRTQDILELKAMTQKNPDIVNKPKKVKTENNFLFEPERLHDIHVTLAMLKEARDKFVVGQVSTSNNVQANLLRSKHGSEIDPTLLEAIQVPPNKDIQYATYKPRLSTNDIISDGAECDQEAIKTWVNVMGGKSGPVTSMVNFIKGIPGFTKLPMLDQIQLIKFSMMEVWLLARHPMFEINTKKFTTATGLTLDLNTAIGPELANLMCFCAGKLQNLHLGPDILFILVAFIVAAPDRCELQVPEETSQLQDKLLDALLYVLYKKYQDKYLITFARIMSVLTELRNVTELYLKMSNTLVTKISDIPPLLSEILTLR